MKKRALLLAMALAVMPVAAHAQQPPQARIEAALTAAASAGLPAALLESKVQEGRAKRVPEARIAAAVEARLQALLRAHDAMGRPDGPPPSADQLSVGADAIQAGVSAEALGRVGAGAPPERQTVAIAVLTQLVQMGYASDQALLHVNAAVRRGPEALANLPGQARAALRARGNIQGGMGLEVGARVGGPPLGIPLPGELRGGQGKGKGNQGGND